jgi:hypothetical protein
MPREPAQVVGIVPNQVAKRPARVAPVGKHCAAWGPRPTTCQASIAAPSAMPLRPRAGGRSRAAIRDRAGWHRHGSAWPSAHQCAPPRSRGAASARVRGRRR